MMEKRRESIIAKLESLDPALLSYVERIVEYLRCPCKISVADNSDIVTAQSASVLSNLLKVHHCFFDGAFTKDKFESAMLSVAKDMGLAADKPDAKTNPGWDIKINGSRFSLKTQANKGIVFDTITISKWMELGTGDWEYKNLMNLFAENLTKFDRVLCLRALSLSKVYVYELVEIPKALMESGINAPWKEVRHRKGVPDPKDPSHRARIVDRDTKVVKYELLFDGGKEKKLQVQNLRKDYCRLHASWTLTPPEHQE